jgi:hypothetical protein
MSLATKTALATLLKGDATLKALLAKDPADGISPAIWEGARNQQGQPSQKAADAYPSVTVRFPDTNRDPRFRPTQAEGGGQSPIVDEIVELDAWSRKSASAEVEQIADRIEELLDGQSFVLPGGAGRVHQAEVLVRNGPLPDPKRGGWFILLRTRLRIHYGV